MKVGDLVKPLVIFDSNTVGIIVSGPDPANGIFGIEKGDIYEILVNGQVCFMFDFELEAVSD